MVSCQIEKQADRLFFQCNFLLLECQTCSLPKYVQTDCYNACSERTCANARRGPAPCSRLCEPDGPKCVCGDGLYRNDCNECVPLNQCNATCTCTSRNYVETDCYNACAERTCANLNTNPDGICTLECQINGPKCVCREDLYRNEFYKCVPKDQCDEPTATTPSPPTTTPPLPTTTPSPVCCLQNYEVTDCYNPCSEKTCENLRRTEPIICPAFCRVGVCQCKGDLYRNDCNECVLKDQCNATCTKSLPFNCPGQYETVYGCFDPSQARVCPDVGFSSPRDVFLKFISESNRTDLCALSTCDCQDGYLRNKCGKCVLPMMCGDPCSGIQCNRPNEQLKSTRYCTRCRVPKHPKQRRSCRKRICRKEPCKGKGNKCGTHCKINRKCKRRRKCRCKQECVCQQGFARNKCGECVPQAEADFKVPCVCTDPCKSIPDQEWQCLNKCNKRTCENFFTLPLKRCAGECNYGCYCSANKELWWNGSACVPSLQCQRQTPA